MEIRRGRVVLSRSEAAVRFVFLHHAGGSAMSYLPLARRLPDTCEPVLLELGGRGTRADEKPSADFPAAVDSMLPVLAGVLDRPAVIVGHSLGALMAHELVCALTDDQRALVRAVVVSAFASPVDAAASASHPGAPFLVRSEEDLVAELRGRGGCPEEVFHDPELLGMAVGLLGHDLHLADTYPGPGTVPHGVGYHVWFGRGDGTVTVDQMERWAQALDVPPKVRTFPGGHFYLDQEPVAQEALITLARDVAERVGAA